MNLDLQLYPKQYEYVFDKARYTGFIGGIGTGKSRALTLKGFLKAFDNPGSYGTITAPTYPMLRDATKRTFFEVVPPDLIAYRNDSENACGVWTPDGTISHVLFRSTSDPDSLRGPNLLWAGMDEAAMSPEEAWLIMMGRIRDTRYPASAQQLFLGTTPKGLNWVYEHFGPAQTDADHHAFYATIWDNPFLSEEFIASLVRNYSGSFAEQELGGKFVAFEGLIYGDLFTDRHVGHHPFDPSLPVDLAWDFGYPAPEVVLAIQVNGRGEVFVIDELYRYRTLTEDMVAEARSRPWFGNVHDCIADEARPDSILRLQELGVPARPSNKGKILDGIQKVRSLLSPDSRSKDVIFHINKTCEGLTKEFSLYRWAERTSHVMGRSDGEEWNDRPIDQYNHALDALRYWVLAKWHPLAVVTNPNLKRHYRDNTNQTRRVMAHQLVGSKRQWL